ncbi:MAG: hypothetical protein KF819_29635 [Labilithrix sp.]|nr:hypothetical protein [Labilithrix sp.]
MPHVNVKRGILAIAIVAGAIACGVACSSFGDEGGPPTVEPDASSSNPDAPAGEDASTPADAAPDTSPPTIRIECLPPTGRAALGDEERVGQPPLQDGGPAYLWGIAPLGDELYVSVGDDFGGGNGAVYRVRLDTTPPTWTLFASTTLPGTLHVQDGYLFVKHKTLTRFPLGCATPCALGEKVVATNTDIDAFFVRSKDSAYALPYFGDALRATRLANDTWDNEPVGPITLGSSYRTLAATNDALFVAQNATDHIQVFPFDAAAPPSEIPSEGGAAVVADCKTLFVLGSPILAIDPATGASLPIGVGSSLSARAVDEDFLYVGYEVGGITRHRKNGTTPDGGEQIAPSKSVWGMAVTRDHVYYGDHGSAGGSGTLFRRKKL